MTPIGTSGSIPLDKPNKDENTELILAYLQNNLAELSKDPINVFSPDAKGSLSVTKEGDNYIIYVSRSSGHRARKPLDSEKSKILLDKAREWKNKGERKS